MDAFLRFWKRVELSPNGCWIWTGPIHRVGYGSFWVRHKTFGAHRWIWEQFNGAVPKGLELHHICGLKHCVNPAHLIPITRGEHVIRTVQPERTHCKNGHPFTHFNGHQQICRICSRAAAMRYYYRKKEAA